VSASERSQRVCKSDLQGLGHRLSLNVLDFNRYAAWKPKQIAAYHQHPFGNLVLPRLDFYQLSTGYRDLGLPKLYLSAEATTLLLAKLRLQLAIATDVATFQSELQRADAMYQLDSRSRLGRAFLIHESL
jgi:hypothetical protein